MQQFSYTQQRRICNQRSKTLKLQMIVSFMRQQQAISQAHWTWGPFPIFGVVPKKYQPDKWCLITDQPSPKGFSVNDAIHPSLCSLSYISVNQVEALAMQLDYGALLAKIDVKSAYHLIPVHPSTCSGCSGMHVDGMLPCGLCPSPKLLTVVADALEWCTSQHRVEYILHYLDDFLIMGPRFRAFANKTYKNLLMFVLVSEFHQGADKQEGRSPILTFPRITRYYYSYPARRTSAARQETAMSSRYAASLAIKGRMHTPRALIINWVFAACSQSYPPRWIIHAQVHLSLHCCKAASSS